MIGLGIWSITTISYGEGSVQQEFGDDVKMDMEYTCRKASEKYTN